MILFGLAGYGGSGKDEVAKILVREHQFRRYAFADRLRDFVYSQNPWVLADGIYWRMQALVDFKGWDWAKRNVPQVREILQETGVWMRENVSPGVWVNMLSDKISADGHPHRVVITDVRFPNEADWVRRRGGYVLRVRRTGVGPVNGHCSEAIDFVTDRSLMNVGTLQDLRAEVGSTVSDFQSLEVTA